MTSEVKVDKLSQKGSTGIVITDDIKLSSGKAIKNAAGTALLTEAGVLDNVTLGSSVVFPAGHVTNAFIFTDTTSGDININGHTTITMASKAFSFPCISGRKYVISGSQSMYPYGSGSGTHRRQHNYLYYGTTNRTFLDTTLDTQIFHGIYGRLLHAVSSEAAGSSGDFSYEGNFTAGSTAPHYFYTAIACAASSAVYANGYNSTTEPHNASVIEIMV